MLLCEDRRREIGFVAGRVKQVVPGKYKFHDRHVVVVIIQMYFKSVNQLSFLQMGVKAGTEVVGVVRETAVTDVVEEGRFIYSKAYYTKDKLAAKHPYAHD